MSSSFQLPAAASEGFKNATAYDTHRPSYPQEAVDSLLSKLGLLSPSGDNEPRVRIVEVASGTGKFTELLAAKYSNMYTNRDEEGPLEVIAVEPHEGMRTQLLAAGKEKKKNLKGVKVVDGHAGELPVGDGWGDGYLAAQSFHWFANEDTLKEAYRVLKSGKGMGIIWNVEDYNKPEAWKATTEWEEKLNEWIRSIPSDGNPRFRDGKWRDAFNNQKLFSLPLGEQTVKWTVWLSEEALWSRINTLSQVAVLEGQERESAIRVFKEALQSDDVERNSKGEVALHGITYFVWTKKI
ncbi:hypothetical protein QBC44DRAFT_350759 [Cladorrhinum sp. PSN332]|nr:hypothetical protein QBC44DRAFT_350759 [Cladorrhinum sp. PSN332]